MNERRTFEVRQAPDALGGRKIMAVTVTGIVTMAVALVIAWRLLEGSQRRVMPAPSPASPRTIGTLEQTLVNDTRRGLDLRQEQERSLHRWRWIDRDAGVAEIPIEQAVDVMLAHPIPVDRAIAPLAPTVTAGMPERPPGGNGSAP